ncbi:MAG: crossover junction endodeoxyribonuclease RuvC [Candidatus Tritonobacter lacicola]|nr:crossover junction endodeoxyribonuclease RuvC [Candidatus Tritonobacter lacicola]
MRVIGIDPGSRVTGYGIIEGEGDNLKLVAFGVIRADPHATLLERYIKIYEEVKVIIGKYAPGEAAVESIFFCKNASSAIKLGEARSVAMLAAGRSGLKVSEYAPKRVKQAVTGVGTAHKSQVQHMVKQILKLDEVPKPADASDAIAIALCHIFTKKRTPR